MAAPEEYREVLLTLEISSITELVSAQQRMRVLVISGIRLSSLQPNQNNVDDLQQHQNYTNGSINGKMSSTLSFPIRLSKSDTTTDINLQCTDASNQQQSTSLHRILNALRRGKNRVVLREWKQGACWWNLNMNHDVNQQNKRDDESNDKSRIPILRRGKYQTYEQDKDAISDVGSDMDTQSVESTQTTLSMARAEVTGYRLSRLAMNYHHDEHRCSSPEQNRIYMPEVLYFSHDDCNATPSILFLSINDRTCHDNDQCNKPWALMSYYEYGVNNDVDENQLYEERIEIEVDPEFKKDFNSDNMLTNEIHSPISLTTANDKTRPCYHFPATMIKIRHEFGFQEPHPRHGRIPIDECLEYSRMILNDVVMPIQSYFFKLNGNTENIDNHLTSIGWCNSNQETSPFQYHDMITIYRQALHQMSITMHDNHVKGTKIDERMKTLLSMVCQCISALECEWEEEYDGKPPPLPPVLCHMDLQPQNLAFGTTNDTTKSTHDNTTSKNDEKYNTKDCFVASVMDWEEACYADPRFEILLICRKLLANLDQAKKLWQSYSSYVKQLNTLFASKSNNDIKQWEVGPLTPWLKLETVHSICTLLLQSMDLLGGGRSPWETKPDLWRKIDRERQRLVKLGWHFCDGM